MDENVTASRVSFQPILFFCQYLAGGVFIVIDRFLPSALFALVADAAWTNNLAASSCLSAFCLTTVFLFIYFSHEQGAMENVLKEAQDVSPKSPVPAPASLPGVVETPPAVSLCLRAPLVLHNLLCVPMLYRVADRQV